MRKVASQGLFYTWTKRRVKDGVEVLIYYPVGEVPRAQAD
jgi:hypothetical protein